MIQKYSDIVEKNVCQSNNSDLGDPELESRLEKEK